MAKTDGTKRCWSVSRLSAKRICKYDIKSPLLPYWENNVNILFVSSISFSFCEQRLRILLRTILRIFPPDEFEIVINCHSYWCPLYKCNNLAHSWGSIPETTQPLRPRWGWVIGGPMFKIGGKKRRKKKEKF